MPCAMRSKLSIDDQEFNNVGSIVGALRICVSVCARAGRDSVVRELSCERVCSAHSESTVTVVWPRCEITGGPCSSVDPLPCLSLVFIVQPSETLR